VGPTISGFALASLLLGQTAGDVQVIGPVPTSGGAYSGGSAQQQLVVTPPNAQPQRRGLFGWRDDRPLFPRMSSWFGRKDGSTSNNTDVPVNGTSNLGPSTPYITPPSAPATSPNFGTPAPAPGSDYPRRMPSTTGQAPPITAIDPAAYQKTASEVKSPLLPANVNKVGRDEKFAWITGQLEVENGVYVLYYATPETVDQYNGRIVLQTTADMKQYHRGDLITAEGQVQTRAGLRGGAVIYRANSVAKVETPTR
jgi:hypothetical protein